MPELNVIVKGKIAQGVKGQYAVCENSDYVVKFDFDDEWSAEKYKTARFIWNDKYEDVVFEGNECNMPIISDTYNVKVGVFAGDLQTTTPAIIITKKSILCGSATAEKPSEDVYSQIMALLNDLKELSDEELAAAIEKYFAENPVSGGIETLRGTTENPVNVLDSALYTGENKVYFITGVMNNCPELLVDINESGMMFGFFKIFAVNIEGETYHTAFLDCSPMQIMFGSDIEIPLYFTFYDNWEGNFETFEWDSISSNLSFMSQDKNNPIDLNEYSMFSKFIVTGYLKNAPQEVAYKAIVINSDAYQYFLTDKIYFRKSGGKTWAAIETFENADALKTLSEDTDSNLLHRGNKLMKESDVTALISEKAKIKNQKAYTLSRVNIGLRDGDEIYLSNAQGQSTFSVNSSTWNDFSEAWIRIKTREWPESESWLTTPAFPDTFVYIGGIAPEIGSNQIWDFSIKGNVVKATQVI